VIIKLGERLSESRLNGQHKGFNAEFKEQYQVKISNRFGKFG
jgi:hypothetical protein